LSPFDIIKAAKEENNMPVLGELESEVLEVIKSNGGQATASDVLGVLRKERDVAYTTVSTTLDRLYRKRLLERKAMPGPGGTKYLFTIGKDEKLKNKIVESTMDRLTAAFGETAYSAIYKHLDDLPEEELERLRKQIDKALKSKSQ
jgi:predicted transcriptional regulator